MSDSVYFIDVTELPDGKPSRERQARIAIQHIEQVAEGDQGKTGIHLSSGRLVVVKESFDEVSRMLGYGGPTI